MSKTLSAEVEHKPYFTTKRMALIGVMTAVTCILGPFSIPLPFSPVPISFTNLAIYLAAYVLGMKACTVSYLIYMLLGMVGVPVFSGFTAVTLHIRINNIQKIRLNGEEIWTK